MYSIVDKVKTLTEESEFKSDKHQLDDYKEALDSFKKMVKEGLIRERGYTLMTPTDRIKHSIKFSNTWDL